MDVKEAQSLLEVIKKNPKLAILVLCLVITVFIASAFVSPYMEEKAKQLASTDTTRTEEIPHEIKRVPVPPENLIASKIPVEVTEDGNIIRVHGFSLSKPGPGVWHKDDHDSVYIADSAQGRMYSYKVGEDFIYELKMDPFPGWPTRILSLAWHGENLLVESWNAHFVCLGPNLEYINEHNLQASNLGFLSKSPWIVSGDDGLGFALETIENIDDENLYRRSAVLAVSAHKVHDIAIVGIAPITRQIAPYYGQTYPLIAFSSGLYYLLHRTDEKISLIRKKLPWDEGTRIELSEDLDRLAEHTTDWATPGDLRDVPVVWGVYAGAEGSVRLLSTNPSKNSNSPSDWCLAEVWGTEKSVSNSNITYCHRPKKPEVSIIPGPTYWLIMEHGSLFGDRSRTVYEDVEELAFIPTKEFAGRK